MASLGLTVNQLVKNELPAGFVVSDIYISDMLRVNQLMLHTAAQISEDNMYTESDWPDEWNVLISYLIIYNILQRAITGGILIGAGSSADGSTTGAGQVKKIVTGPAEVEYQDTAAAFSTLIKNLTTDPNSIWGLITYNTCALGMILGVKLPFCRQLKTGAIFYKAGRSFCLTDFMQFLHANSLCNPCQPKSMG